MASRESSAPHCELPPPQPELFPEPATRERLEDLLTRELLAAQRRVLCGPVTPTLDMGRFRQELAQFDFNRSRPLEELLSWTVRQLEAGVVHMTHPRYFGLFNPPASFPAQCADRISGAFNPQLASSGSSPAPVAIEAHVIAALAARAGFPPSAAGHFTTAGSEANYTALVCALTGAEPSYDSQGVRAFSGAPTVYTSRECQPGWFKIAHQAGIGRAALRLVATDGQGRMDCAALRQAIERDRAAGAVPVLIAATAGTTGGGMIDPLRDCGELARELHLWYHIDAAWGGAVLACERLRGLLSGIQLADSLTIDAHKWFSTTMGCGMFITRHPQVLSQAFRVTTDFMPSSVSQLDPYLNSVQWSRRFLGLRLFLSLAAAGWSGYARHIERAVCVTGAIEAALRARDWRIANHSELAVLCALPPPGSLPPRAIAAQVLASGRAWVAVTRFEGLEVLRICATHGEISAEDVDILISTLEQARRPSEPSASAG
jgi:glutamate/tyrosine decarboxylase-like PLP-dependent enzyme